MASVDYLYKTPGEGGLGYDRHLPGSSDGRAVTRRKQHLHKVRREVAVELQHHAAAGAGLLRVVHVPSAEVADGLAAAGTVCGVDVDRHQRRHRRTDAAHRQAAASGSCIAEQALPNWLS